MTDYKREFKQLTYQHKHFIAAYVLSGDATKAAIEAGYSERCAAQQGCNLLNVPNIKKEIERKVKFVEMKLDIGAERVLGELFAIATCDIREAFESDNSIKRIRDLPEMLARTIKSVEVDKESGRVCKITFYDKTKALELLANHLKLLNNKVEIDIGDNLSQLIEQGRQRVAQRALTNAACAATNTVYNEVRVESCTAIDAQQVEQSSQESTDNLDYMKKNEAKCLIGNSSVDDAKSIEDGSADMATNSLEQTGHEQGKSQGMSALQGD